MIRSLPARLVWALGLALVAAVLVGWRSGAEPALVALVGAVAAAFVANRADTPATVADAAPEPQPVEAVIDAIADPVLIVAHGRVVLANRASRALLGDHVAGEDVRVALRHPAAAELLADPDAPLPDQPVELAGLGTLDGRWLLHVADAGGGARLAQLTDQTASRAAEKARTDFVANASHELRTPLASVLGYVETLRDDEAGADSAIRQRFLRIIFDEARRMQRLVEDLISLSRIEAEKHRRPAGAIDLGQLAAEVCAEIRASGNPRAADLHCATDPDLPPVAGDRPQLSQLLHNLVGNAMKYGRPDTPVDIAVRRGDRNMLVLTVTDRGDGIPPEHVPRLTERFYRVDAGRSRSLGGTGLGLSIVKHIVEHHRGYIDIASRLGIGTAVAVTLPEAAPAPAVIKP